LLAQLGAGKSNCFVLLAVNAFPVIVDAFLLAFELLVVGMIAVDPATFPPPPPTSEMRGVMSRMSSSGVERKEETSNSVSSVVPTVYGELSILKIL